MATYKNNTKGFWLKTANWIYEFTLETPIKWKIKGFLKERINLGQSRRIIWKVQSNIDLTGQESWIMSHQRKKLRNNKICIEYPNLSGIGGTWCFCKWGWM